MIDVHSHLLPGIDDGASTWEDTLAMARAAVRDGVRTMVATPHMMPDGVYANRRSEVLALVEEARDRLAQAGIELRLVAGGELYASLETAKGIEDGSLLTYADQKRYALVEMPAAEIPPFMDQLFFECRVRRVTPVLAHPERNRGVLKDMDRLLSWVQNGVLLQVNARSLLGRSGGPSRAVAEELVRRRMVHLIASDAHSLDRRPPGLSEAKARVSELAGDEIARVLVKENPGRLIAGESLHVWEPIRPSRGGLVARLFGAAKRRLS